MSRGIPPFSDKMDPELRRPLLRIREELLVLMGIIGSTSSASSTTSEATNIYSAELTALTNAISVDSAGAIRLGLPTSTGFWPDVDTTTRIHRIRDRVFIGGASETPGTNTSGQGPIFPTAADGANWALRDAQVIAAGAQGLIALTAVSRTEDLLPGPNTVSIAVSGVVVNNNSGRTTRAMYADVQHELGAASMGLEVAAKNTSGLDTVMTPYSNASGSTPVIGAILTAGGDPTYGGTANAPSAAAIRINKGPTAIGTWNSGIIIEGGSCTLDGSGRSEAIAISARAQINWWAGTANKVARIRSDNTNTSGADVGLIMRDNAFRFEGTGEASIFRLSHTSGGENWIELSNAVAGQYPEEKSQGVSTNIGFSRITKGTGSHRFFTGSTASEEARIGGYSSTCVNFIQLNGGATGTQAVAISAQGSDANPSVYITGKGSGGVVLRDGSSAEQIKVNTTGIGFFGAAPAARPAGVVVSAAGIHAALVTLGLITA